MARKTVVVGEHERKKKKEAPKEERKSEVECKKSSMKEGMKEKKVVRFSVEGEDKEEKRKGVVRIRLVVTKEELRQILNGESSAYSSSEELMSAIKLGSRSRRIRMDDQPFSSSDGDIKSRKWKPALESIPEF